MLKSDKWKEEIKEVAKLFRIKAFFDVKADFALQLGIVHQWNFKSIKGDNMASFQDNWSIFIASEITLGKFLKANVNLSKDGLDLS